MSQQPVSNRINIAFTPAGEEAARRILDRLPIGGMVDVARVAIAFALRDGIGIERPADFGSASGANYNVGSVDPSSQLRSAVIALRPELDADPNRVMETLMSVGALAIDAKVQSGDIHSVADLLATSAPASQDASAVEG